MKAKISKGASFRGLLNYLMDNGRGELIGGNMTETSKAGLSAEFGLTRSTRPDIARPVWHCSLSLPPGDDLTPEQWQETAAAFCRKMDIKNNQYCVIRHRDKAHQHVHIVINRITQDGGVWQHDRDVYRAIEACRQLEAEKDYLRDTSDRNGSRSRFYPSYREQSRPKKGKDISRRKIHDSIQLILSRSTQPLTPKEFIEQLRAAGIEARPNISGTGRLNGFSFSQDDKRFTGSKVGVKWAQLKQQLDYLPRRDNAYLMGLVGRKPSDFALSPQEFARYAELLDKYLANPSRAIDLRDDIKRIGLDRLLRGAKDMQAAHYEQLSALYEEQRRTWAKIRAQRPPLRLPTRDIGSLAILLLASPPLAALVLLPFAIDRIIRAHRRGKADEIAAEIQRIKDEIKRGQKRQQAVKEIKQCEVLRTMRERERRIIIEHTTETICETAKKGKDFRGYVDYVSDNGIRDTEITYDELAQMYDPDVWVGNEAVLRGVSEMVDRAAMATAERPENRALYVFPLACDVLGKMGVGAITGQQLEMTINKGLTRAKINEYMRKDLDAGWAEMLVEARQLNAYTKEIEAQRLSVSAARQEIPAKKANFRGYYVLTRDEYDYFRQAEKERQRLEVEVQQHNINRWRIEQERDRLERENRELETRRKEIQDRYSIQVKCNEELQRDVEELQAVHQSVYDFLAANGLIDEYEKFCETREEITDTIEQLTATPEL